MASLDHNEFDIVTMSKLYIRLEYYFYGKFNSVLAEMNSLEITKIIPYSKDPLHAG